MKLNKYEAAGMREKVFHRELRFRTYSSEHISKSRLTRIPTNGQTCE
jgi:hypothetical protein